MMFQTPTVLAAARLKDEKIDERTKISTHHLLDRTHMAKKTLSLCAFVLLCGCSSPVIEQSGGGDVELNGYKKGIRENPFFIGEKPAVFISVSKNVYINLRSSENTLYVLGRDGKSINVLENKKNKPKKEAIFCIYTGEKKEEKIDFLETSAGIFPKTTTFLVFFSETGICVYNIADKSCIMYRRENSGESR